MSFRALRGPRCLAAAAVAAVLLAPVSTTGQGPAEDFTGFAINMNSGPRTATVDIRIERWSTDAERDRLFAILIEEKDPYRANDKLLKALQKMPKAGFIKTPQRLGWDLRFARQWPLDGGGRRIVVATDRPVGFAEAATQPRTMDYPFTIVEFRLDKNDRGEGKILAGTKLLIDDNKQLVLEQYAQQPVRFNEIKKRK